MVRSAPVVVTALASFCALASAQQPQFRTGNDTVSVYATASDAGGRLVTDLTRDDFEIFDNGVRQPIAIFANDTRPITVVVMLDRSASVENHFDLVREAAGAFVENLFPADKARVGSFSRQIAIDPEDFTSDRDKLLEILGNKLQDAGPTPLWDATAAAMRALETQDGRRVVLIFTDGYDSPASLGPHATFSDVRDRSLAEDVMVYGIGLAQDCAYSTGRDDADAAAARPEHTSQRLEIQGRSGQSRSGQGRGGPGRGRPGSRLPRPPIPRPPILLPPPQPPRMPSPEPPRSIVRSCTTTRPDPDLRALTEVGGGGYFELRSAGDLVSTFARVADELHRQYLLGFTAPALDDTVHRLEVRSKRTGVTVRARTSYVAASRLTSATTRAVPSRPR